MVFLLGLWSDEESFLILPGEHVAIFGMTGSGKSTLTRKVRGLFSRVVIFDRLQEWAHATPVHDFESFKVAYRELFEAPAFEIVIKPRPGMSTDALLDMTDKILALIYQVEMHQKKGLSVIFEEVWLYAPIHSIPQWFQETMLTGRHYGISIVGNSQRPASVSKTLVSQARHIFIGQFYEARDRKYFEECFGRIPELANPPQKFTFYWFRPNQKTVLISTN